MCCLKYEECVYEELNKKIISCSYGRKKGIK
jgi:hypothetical protein